MLVVLRKSGVAPRVLRVAAFKGVAARRLGGIVVSVVAVAAGPVAFRFDNVAGLLDKAAELSNRHLGFPKEEVAGDAYAMHGRFVVEFLETLTVVLRIIGGQ